MTKAKKAIDLIENTKEFNGKSLRDLFNKIDNLQFKNAGQDVIRQDTNNFIKSLSSEIRGTVAESSPEFAAMNKAFSGEVQLADEINRTLGKMKFKGNNLSEFTKASESIKRLLDKSDIGAENVDKFLTKFNIDPSEFRAQEAVRRVVSEPIKPEGAGFSPFELVRQMTAGIVDPTDATRIASFIEKLPSIQQNKVVDLLEKTPVESRAILIKGLTDIFSE